MKLTKIIASVAAVLITCVAVKAEAGTITYDLTDAPLGASSQSDAGFYRFVGGNPTYELLSFEQNGADAQFVYDDTAGTARLFGQAYNLNGGEFVSFDLTYDNVSRDGDTLTLNDMDTVGLFGTTSVEGKGFNLTLGDSISGNGWLLNTALGGHFGDFHFTGVRSDAGGKVPSPGPLALIAAMGLFGAWRRKRAN